MICPWVCLMFCRLRRKWKSFGFIKWTFWQLTRLFNFNHQMASMRAVALIKSICLCNILSRVVPCLFINVLAMLTNAFPMWGSFSQSLSNLHLFPGTRLTLYATKTTTGTKAKHPGFEEAFHLSGVRVGRGKPTPPGIQWHLLFSFPCRNKFKWPSGDWRKKAALIVWMHFYAFEFGSMWRDKDGMTISIICFQMNVQAYILCIILG